ncbi:MAG TPA: hypothetical protein VGK24_18530 [Candidatus Angelobacter sp.]
MKVLLDECIDQRFRKELTGVDCITVQETGWAGKKNGGIAATRGNNVPGVYYS